MPTSPNDIINVEPPLGVLCSFVLARVLSVQHDGFHVQYAIGTYEFDKRVHSSARTVAWRPEDIRDNFIVLRRRVGRTEQHLDKHLRVHRNCLKRVMLLFDAGRRMATVAWRRNVAHVL